RAARRLEVGFGDARDRALLHGREAVASRLAQCRALNGHAQDAVGTPCNETALLEIGEFALQRGASARVGRVGRGVRPLVELGTHPVTAVTAVTSVSATVVARLVSLLALVHPASATLGERFRGLRVAVENGQEA